MFHRASILSGIVLLVATSALSREWTDRTGKHRIEADLQTIKGGFVSLRKPDGSSLSVPLEQLCQRDRALAVRLCSTAAIVFQNGNTLECTVLQETRSALTLLYGFGLIHISRAEVKEVNETEAEHAMSAVPPPRISDFRTIVIAASIEPWASELRQVPATVIGEGVMRNVPYKSFRAGQAYEINVYGDPAFPGGFEVGVRGGVRNGDAAKRNCVAFVCGLLRDPTDREALCALSLEKGKTTIKGLTLEITPSTAPDAYGGWWVSAYDENALNSGRATDKEMKSITIAKSPAKPKPRSVGSRGASGESLERDSGSANESRNQYGSGARGGSTSSKCRSGGTVYVKGYYRKDGTYVHPHTRIAPHSRR